MIKWLNYHHLLYFRTIASEGSLAKASKVLNIGQSALSTQLKQLEENLGYMLFERKNRSLLLTHAGKVALEYADEIFQKGEEFVQVFNSSTLSTKSTYKIGASDSIAKSLVCSLVEKAQRFSKDRILSLSEGTPEELMSQIRNHELDLVMTTGVSDPGNKDFVLKELKPLKISVFGSSKFSKLKKNFPHSLEGQPIILPMNHTKLRYDLEHFFSEHKIHYNLVAEVQDSSVKKLMAVHGKALIFLPTSAGQDLVKDNKLIRLGDVKGLSEQYWLAHSKQDFKNPLTEFLMDQFSV